PRPGGPPAAPGSLRRLLVCLVLVTALSAVDQTIVATALPAVGAELGAAGRTSWVLTAYVVALAVAMPVVGSLADRVGRVRMLRVSIVVFVVASLLCAAAQDVGQLAAARAVQGLGGAGMLVLPQALVAEVVPARDRAAVLGPLGAVFAVATVVGPLLGGTLTDAGSWRAVFWVNLPVGALALLLACTAVRQPAVARPAERFDVLGAVLLAAATTGLAASATEFPARGATPAVAALLAATAGALALLVLHQSRARHPLLPVTSLRGRTVGACAALSALAGFAMFGVIAYVPSWIQGVHRTSATVSGLFLLPVTLGIVTGVNLSGFAVRRHGHWRRFPVLGCALGLASTTALALVGDLLPLAATAVLLVVFGAGAGLFLQIVVVVAQDAGAARSLGGVTAAMTYVRECGVTVGTGLLGGLLASRLAADGATGTAADYGAAFTTVFLTVAAVFALGVAVAALMPRHELGTHPVDAAAAGTATRP
ncbi:MFS transporter, partial [Kineococcus sp. R8]|uniref:MFS transporter n=1 Tax=Kineococcus siccus TaxID=2696567 RepID=UPI0014137319